MRSRGLAPRAAALAALALPALAALVLPALALPAAVATALPSAVGAQEAPRVEEGRTVRVTSPALVHHTLEGTLVGRSGDALLVRPDGGVAVELDLADVRRLEVATGRHRGTLRGAFTGLWSGLVLGLIIFEIDEADDEIDPDCGELQCFEAPFFWAMSLGGAAVGAAIGSLFHVTEWSDVPPGRLEVSAGPARGARGPGRVAIPSPPALELRIELVF